MTIKPLCVIVFSVCMLCCAQSLRAQFFRHAKDCTITIHTEDYDADTVSSSSNQVIRYSRGKEVYNLSVQLNGRNQPDSTLVLTSYNDRGEKTRVIRRDVSCMQCQKAVRDSSAEQVYFPWEGFPTKMISYSCCSVYSSITIFSDTMAVSHSWYTHEGDTSVYSDTVYFYSNHLKKSHAHYEKGVLGSRIDYTYKFHGDGSIAEIKQVDTSRGTTTTMIRRNIYHGKDTIPVYHMSFEGRDSTELRVSVWDYNEKFKQTGYRGWINGKLTGFINIHYSEDGCHEESIGYTGDSLIESHHYSWRTYAPGRMEVWGSQYSKRWHDSNGNSYYRYDTLKAGRGTIHRAYGAKYSGDPASKISLPLSECTLFYELQYDQKERLLLQKNYQNEGGKLSYYAVYTYSR